MYRFKSHAASFTACSPAMLMHKKPKNIESAAVALEFFEWALDNGREAYGIVLDAHGKIGWGRSEIGGDPIVVVLSEAVSDTHPAGLRGEDVSYIFAGKSELDLPLTLDILNSELGVRRLLLEGGGGANGAFLRAGLVDELNLILCPAVDGAKGH
jgi:riboflavin biosynthesis pyrimidine reductase